MANAQPPASRPHSFSFSPHFLVTAIALALGLLTGYLLPHSHPPLQPPPYRPYPIPNSCTPPPSLKPRSGVRSPSPHCFTIRTLTPSSITATLNLFNLFLPLQTVTVSISSTARLVSPPRAVHTFPTTPNLTLTYTAANLPPSSDFVLIATLTSRRKRTVACRAPFHTPSSTNLVRNPGFEDAHPAPAPHVATDLVRPSARGWTSFYNGGFSIACGVPPARRAAFGGAAFPRSGLCAARLGGGGAADAGGHPVFYGAHQAVAVPRRVAAVVVSAWVFVAEGTTRAAPAGAESAEDSLVMAAGLALDDGRTVEPVFVQIGDVGKVGEWRFVCVTLRAPPGRWMRMVHVFFHFHDRRHGELYVDDVGVEVGGADDGRARGCYSHEVKSATEAPAAGRRDAPPVRHLKATVRPRVKQLTIAVPLTADRVLRLEALSRSFGGGPVAAAVLVRDEEEARMFVHIWSLNTWLRRHVDVTLVYMSRARVRAELIPINALRNTAVSLAVTDYTIMLDVDMTPATAAFACFRDAAGSVLGPLVPLNGSHVFTAPVFITDIHLRAPTSKHELLGMMHANSAAPYCLNSQKATKIERKWCKAHQPYETRFTTDYEPYGIVSRSAHVAYDERFVGYGFNKISWAWGAEASGARLFVLNDAFLTHLNHVDNAWVAEISVPTYLRTWRRYFSFVAEAVATHGEPLAAAYIPRREPVDAESN